MTDPPEPDDEPAVVGIIMGSRNDWTTMQFAAEMLCRFDVPTEAKVVSAHRTPAAMVDYARGAADRGIEVIIAGAGGAAHLPGMVAGETTLPVIGVPVRSRALSGVDSLLSIVQMPAGVPVATMAIGDAGAKNAALLALRILALHDDALGRKLSEFIDDQSAAVSQTADLNDEVRRLRQRVLS